MATALKLDFDGPSEIAKAIIVAIKANTIPAVAIRF